MLVANISSEAAIPGWQHPAPLRTWKLSSRGPHQYWAGRLPGNVRCCFLFHFFEKTDIYMCVAYDLPSILCLFKYLYTLQNIYCTCFFIFLYFYFFYNSIIIFINAIYNSMKDPSTNYHIQILLLSNYVLRAVILLKINIYIYNILKKKIIAKIYFLIFI